MTKYHTLNTSISNVNPKRCYYCLIVLHIKNNEINTVSISATMITLKVYVKLQFIPKTLDTNHSTLYNQQQERMHYATS